MDVVLALERGAYLGKEDVRANPHPSAGQAATWNVLEREGLFMLTSHFQLGNFTAAFKWVLISLGGVHVSLCG